MLFPSADVALEAEQDLHSWDFSAPWIRKELHLLRLSDMEHRFTVTGASVGGQLFIFDELFCRENSTTMRELILAAHAAPRSDADALDLAKLYLALSYYRLDDPTKFIALKGTSNTTFSDTIGIAHSPEVSHRDGAYFVDLYTYSKLGATGGPVTHWRIELEDSRFDELMAAHSQKLRPDESGRSNLDEKGGRFFNLDIMANGFTNDGATTDMQSWSASDGPGIFRTHYYYKSHEKAEARMQHFLENAVAMLENDASQKTAGEVPVKRALVVQINKDEKSLFASQLYAEENSVLEFSCSCLRNLRTWLGNAQTPEH